jgi:hypothetical protein
MFPNKFYNFFKEGFVLLTSNLLSWALRYSLVEYESGTGDLD